MKKIFTLLFAMIIITGCSMSKEDKNTPANKVRAYMDSYQNLDESLLDDLDDLIDGMDSYSDNQKERYRELMKKHYKDLSYEIKSESISGNEALVEVEINVLDYSNVINNDTEVDNYQLEDGTYDTNAYYDYQLDQLESINDKVKYTVVFSVKQLNGEWIVEEPSEIVKQKIHGIYNY